MGIGSILSKVGASAANYGKTLTPGNIVKGMAGFEPGLFAKAPVVATGMVTSGIAGLGLLAAPIAKGAYDDGTNSSFERQLRQETATILRQQAEQMKMERLQQGMALNEQRLMQANPHLYNSIMAGRPLARGAVPIGGGQRRDVLDLVTRQMAEGTL